MDARTRFSRNVFVMCLAVSCFIVSREMEQSERPRERATPAPSALAASVASPPALALHTTSALPAWLLP